MARKRDHDKDDALFKEYNDRFAWKMRENVCTATMANFQIIMHREQQKKLRMHSIKCTCTLSIKNYYLFLVSYTLLLLDHVLWWM